MGQGLGKNSPVVLTLGKANYEALLERHGQWIRWRTSTKCSCVNVPSMQPDIHCKFCHGTGIVYTYQKNQIVFSIVGVKDTDGIILLDDEYKDCTLIKVYDTKGNLYENAEKFGSYIYLNSSTPLVKGIYLNVLMSKETVSTLKEKTECVYKGNGFYEISELVVKKPNIEGIYYSAPSDILEIQSITDNNGKEYEAEEFRLNQFQIKGNTYPEKIYVQNVKFIPPFLFVLLNQNLTKADIMAVTEFGGDAVITFPYTLDVSTDDVLTNLVGSYVNKEVITRSDYLTDTLAAYFVSDIIACTGIYNNEEYVYKLNEDFILTGTNKIKWISENKPDIGETYSISYHVLPTYKVVKEIPQLRTSENQRFPKKAVVKLFSSYSEKRGVNIQTERKGFDGSL